MEQKSAPTFVTSDHKGNTISLSTYQGKKVLLYFYPKDMTSGCTTEALGFQERYAAFQDLNTEIFGISPDNAESHQKFCDQHGLAFPLLIDHDGIIAKQYGVLKPKENGAISFNRESFLIDEHGIILKHWRTVNPATHPEEVLEYIKTHSA